MVLIVTINHIDFLKIYRMERLNNGTKSEMRSRKGQVAIKRRRKGENGEKETSFLLQDVTPSV